MTPDQANVTFVAQDMSAIPQYDGHPLSFVGGVPANQNADPNAPGYQNLTMTNAVMYVVVCSGVPTGYGMYVPGTGAPAGSAAAVPTPALLKTVALSTAGSIAMPAVAINTSPLDAGEVHLNTWFWATGYAGGPITEVRSALGATIEVDAVPTSYTWDFGDASAPLQTTSLGVAWQPSYTPNPSTVDCNFDGTPVDTGEPFVPGAVTHCYTNTSTRAGFPAGFPVALIFNLAVSYRVNGGPPIALPPISRTADLPYRVIEVNTVITSR